MDANGVNDADDDDDDDEEDNEDDDEEKAESEVRLILRQYWKLIYATLCCMHCYMDCTNVYCNRK